MVIQRQAAAPYLSHYAEQIRWLRSVAAVLIKMGTNSKGERIRQPQQRQQKKEGVKVFHPKRIRKRKELISLFIIGYDCEVTHIEDYNSPTKADSHESFFPGLDISLNLFTALMALGCENQTFDSAKAPVTRLGSIMGSIQSNNGDRYWRITYADHERVKRNFFRRGELIVSRVFAHKSRDLPHVYTFGSGRRLHSMHVFVS